MRAEGLCVPQVYKPQPDAHGRTMSPTMVTEIKAFSFASDQRHQRFVAEVLPRREQRLRQERRLAARRAAEQKVRRSPA